MPAYGKHAAEKTRQAEELNDKLTVMLEDALAVLDEAASCEFNSPAEFEHWRTVANNVIEQARKAGIT